MPPPAEPNPQPAPPDTSADRLGDAELVDDPNGLVLRRIVVGPLATNCWAAHPIGSRNALLVDPGDEPAHVLDAVHDLHITAIALTHTHFDHVLAVPHIADATGAPVHAHPAEQPVWPHELDTLHRTGHFDAGTATSALLDAGCRLQPQPAQATWHGHPNHYLHDAQKVTIGPLSVEVLHTPGHTPGGVTLALPGHLLTGDTLFPGGPGLTGWPLSDFDTIMQSVRRLLQRPADTAVHPGHGLDTTIGQERPHIEHWQQRGW